MSGSTFIQPDALLVRLPAPVLPRWRTETLFGNSNPLEIDAGSGKGRFITARAQAHPELNFLGIEWQQKRIERLVRRASRHHCINTRFVRADITFILTYLIHDGAVQTIYLFYPDPWPKRRHHQRRLVQPAFLDLVARKLQPGGKLHFATDNIAYAAAARASMEHHAILQPCPVFLPRPEEKTDFELLFEKQGLFAQRFSVWKPTD